MALLRHEFLMKMRAMKISASRAEYQVLVAT